MAKRIQTRKFKDRCLKLVDKVHRTKRNKPEEKDEPLFGKMQGTVRIVDDIVAPVDEVWDASLPSSDS